MKIRIGNDFKTKWAITWLGEPEDFSDATDIALFFNIYDKKIELTKDVDYTITNNIIEIDVTPDICNILGVYNLELHYIKPNSDFIDGERRSAVDIDAFRIVGKSEKADATQDVSIISDAVAIFLDIAYKKLEEIEANEDVRIANEGERKDAEDIRVANEDIRISNEQDRQINTATAISNAEQATLNANNSAVYANEQGSYAEEMSLHPPTIIDDYWHIWNFTTNQYESTGQYARGDSAIDGALVVQEKGQSAVNTMSQKAVTDELAQLAGDLRKKLPTVNINHINQLSLIEGSGFIGASGNVTANSNYRCTDAIEIQDGSYEVIVKTGVNSLAVALIVFYNNSNQTVSSVMPTTTGVSEGIYTVPGGAVYYRTSCEKSYYSDFLSYQRKDSTVDDVINPIQDEINYIKTAIEVEVFLSPNGSDIDGNGKIDNPFKTTSRARSLGYSKFILLDGIYESNDVSLSGGESLTSLNRRKAIVRGSSRREFTDIMLHEGEVYVIDTGTPISILREGLWVHDIPDETTLIPPHQKIPYNFDTYRLGSTRVWRVDSYDELLQEERTAYFVDGSNLYLKGHNIHLISEMSPLVNPLNETTFIPSLKGNKSYINGVSFEYMGIQVRSDLEVNDCSVMYGGSFAFHAEDVNFTIKNSKMGGITNNALAYDGSGGSSKVREINNYIHDCDDQGSSCHSMTEIYRENCLFTHCAEGVADVGDVKVHMVGCHFLWNVKDIRFTFYGDENNGCALIVNCVGNGAGGIDTRSENNVISMNSRFAGSVSSAVVVI